MIDQFHLTFTVPRTVPGAEARAVCRTLRGASFRGGLGRSARAVIGRYPSLAKVRVTVAR
jgi:hypothetical protein